MSSSTIMSGVVNKPANLGSDAPKNIEVKLSYEVYADDDTGEPVGILIAFPVITQGDDEYIADSAAISDGVTAVTLEKKV